MRAQYDRDRLGYLYAHFKSYELFPDTAAAEKNKSRDDQIEVYAAALQDHISDPIEDKKIKIHARLLQIRTELEEYKEKSKNVQEEWAISPNQILRMGANALREVEICGRADIEMLENELGDLRGELPPKNIDGSPGRIASGQYGSEMGAQSKSKFPLAVNQRAPSIPRSPTVPVHSRSASKLGVRIGKSSTGDESSSTARSDSTMAVDDRVQRYLMGSVHSPTFYVPSTYLDATNKQHDMDGIVARAKRQSLNPETLSDLSMVKSDKLPKPAERTGFAGLDPATLCEYDPATKLNKLPSKKYGDFLNGKEGVKRLDNIGETPELSETQCDYEAPTTMAAVQMNVSPESSSSNIFPGQSPPGLGLVEYQERFGCHVITEDVKEKMKKETAGKIGIKSGTTRKRLPKPWVSINDSVKMPAHLSSIRTTPHVDAGSVSMSLDDMDLPIDRPNRPFQRTSRGASSVQQSPIHNGRVKKALSSVGDELMEQTKHVAQPDSRKTTQRTAMVGSVQAAVWEQGQMAKAARGAEELKGSVRKESDVGNESKVIQEAMEAETMTNGASIHASLERPVSRMNKEEAARTLIQLSRGASQASEHRDTGEQKTGGDILAENPLPHVLPQTSVQTGRTQQSFIPFNWAYDLYDQTQKYSLAQQLASIFPSYPDRDSLIPPIYQRDSQPSYQARGYIHKSFNERSSPYGALGGEIRGVKDRKAQKERQAAIEKAIEAGRFDRNLIVSLQNTEDPFVD